MDYKTSNEDHELRSVTRRLLEKYSPVERRIAEGGSPGADDQQLAVERFVQDGWLAMLGARSDSTPARMVTAVHVASSFGVVPTVGIAPVVFGFLAPLASEMGGSSLDRLTEAMSGQLVTCPIPRFPTFNEPVGTVRSASPDSAVVHLEHDVRDIIGPLESGAVAIPVAGDRGITVALVDLNSFRAGTIESTSSGVDLSAAAMTIHCAGLDVPARILGSSMPPASWSSAVGWARACYRLWLSSQAVGGAEEIVRRTVAHLISREQFGRPLAAFQALRHRVADMETAAQNASAVTFEAAWRLGEGSTDAEDWIAAAWLCSARAYRAVCEAGIQCHGAMGFTWEGGIHLWWRNALWIALHLESQVEVTGELAARMRVAAQQVTP